MATEDFTSKFKDLKLPDTQDINILLLGETGVGKSTFVNSIANYLHYKKFKKASKGELLILIPSVITVTNKNLQSVTLRVGSEDNNEYQEIGEAGTQDVKTYVFPIGEGKARLRFIDSPGMGDPRGIEQDDINCENILAYLSQLNELHAICFLMKPTTTRITVFFEYCVKQILSRLEKSASKNIIFIFTNTRGSNYTAGDTLPCLKKIVEVIKSKPPNVDIPLKNSNIFNLDNEAFRYLVATKHDIEYDESVQMRFMESWEKSSKECWRLITYIVGDTANDPLKPHQLQNTMSINEARRLVVQLSKPLADISQLIYDNIRILDRHQINLKMENQSLDELKKKLFIPALDLEVTQLTQPVTVCTSTKCVEMIKVGEMTKPHYRQRCHDPCYLTNVGKEIVGDPNLVNCAAMCGKRNCSKCTCDYLVHMHVYYMSKTVEKHIMDQVVQQNINQKEVAVREAHRLMREIDRRKTELEEERDMIIRSTAQFAHFLQNNAISPFNDSYKGYIEYLITREQTLGRHGDQGVVNNLKQLLLQYDEIKQAFDEGLSVTDQLPQVDAGTVIQQIHKLYQLKHNGKKIKELMKKQRTSRKFEHDKTCEYVHPNSAGVYTVGPKKDKAKKKDAKSTDDERSKKDKKKSNSKDSGDSRKHVKNEPHGRGNYHHQGNRTQQYQQRSNSTHWRQEPPPPYPGSDSHRLSRPFQESSSGRDKDGNHEVVVKVHLNQNPKHKDEDNSNFDRPDYYGPPRQDYHYSPPSQGPYHNPPHPPQHHGPPPPSQYYGHSSQYPGQYYGPPPPPPPSQGPPPRQGEYYGSQGYYGPDSYRGPPRGEYQGYNYGSEASYHGPPPPTQYQGPPQRQYHGPPQGQYHGGPQSQYTGPSQKPYQKQYKPSRGRPYQKRGTEPRRGRSRSQGGKSKKSGNEKSYSDSESTSSSD